MFLRHQDRLPWSACMCICAYMCFVICACMLACYSTQLHITFVSKVFLLYQKVQNNWPTVFSPLSNLFFLIRISHYTLCAATDWPYLEPFNISHGQNLLSLQICNQMQYIIYCWRKWMWAVKYLKMVKRHSWHTSVILHSSGQNDEEMKKEAVCMYPALSNQDLHT